MTNEDRNARVTAFMARAQRNPRTSSYPVSEPEDMPATMKARHRYLNLTTRDGLDREDKPEPEPVTAPSGGIPRKPLNLRPQLNESMIRIERWWRTIDRVQSAETDPAEIEWQRFADDAHYIRESLIHTLQYLSDIEYNRRSIARGRRMERAELESVPALATEGLEHYSRVWRDLPRVEAWVKSVQGVLNSEDCEILMGATKDSVPIVVSALDDAAELLDYLRSFVERQG